MNNIPRLITVKVIDALKTSPVVFINGMRQSGKSTLASFIAKNENPAEYITFDNPMQMSAASMAPMEFLKSKKGPIIIDEVQLVPELFRALKRVVDELRLEGDKNINGKFLLTGSTNILALPRLSDPLVGRMSILTLYPFSTAEKVRSRGTFIERLFNQDFDGTTEKNLKLLDAIELATFPEIASKSSNERVIWINSYLTTLLQREVRNLAAVEKIALLPNLLRMLASRSGSLINDADIARNLAINPVTERNYRAILQMLFLVFDIKPWFRNIGKRLVKAPKGYISDTLLLCHLLDIRLERLQLNNPSLFGHVIENFVASEIVKLLSYGHSQAQLYHFRTSDGKEIDFILEQPDGRLAAIEVKTSEIIGSNDFKTLKIFQDQVKEDFVTGIVLYPGKEIILFGEKLWAVPLFMLWQ
jgi:predicted AAA+ superfamily ATPase